MSIKVLKHGIKLMKWRRRKNTNAWVFAKAWTLRGYIVLRLRGYRPHPTVFGMVLRKDLVKTSNKTTMNKVTSSIGYEV